MDNYQSEEQKKSPSFAFSQAKILSFRYWLIFFILLGILLIIIVWAFLGDIPITVQGKGIVISRGGLFSIQTKQTGIVRDIHVKMGQIIKKGDLLLEIYDPQVELKLKSAKIRLDTLEKQWEQLKSQIHAEALEEKNALQTKIEAQRFTVHLLEDEVNMSTQELEKRREFLKEGLISLSSFRDAEQELLQKRIDLEERRETLATLNAQVKKEYRADELRDKEQQLINAREEYKLLQLAVEEGKVYSPYEGQVLAVMANLGDLVHVGTPLIWLEHALANQTNDFIIYAFFPIETGKRIRLNMPSTTTLSNVDPHQYGAMKGHVADISSFAVSKENIANQINNQALIEYLTSQSTAVLQVLIEPDRNPKTQQVEWTSGTAPPFPISTGTVGNIEVTVEKIRPIYYLIPLPQFKYFSQAGEE